MNDSPPSARMTGPRRRILAALEAAGGRIHARDGRAVDALHRAIGADLVSLVALRQQLAGLDAAGLIRRDVRGKRTYEISLPLATLTARSAAPASEPEDETAESERGGGPFGDRNGADGTGARDIGARGTGVDDDDDDEDDEDRDDHRGEADGAHRPLAVHAGAPASDQRPTATATSTSSTRTWPGPVAGFVDLAWLVAQAGIACHGVTERADLDVDNASLVELVAASVPVDGGGFLRSYVYDAGRDRESRRHRTLTAVPGVALRLGRLSGDGHRHGVETLVVRDLVLLAAQGRIRTAVVAAGSADLLDALQTVRDLGVAVVLLTAPGPAATRALEALAPAADGLVRLDRAALADCVRRRTAPADGTRSDSVAASAATDAPQVASASLGRFGRPQPPPAATPVPSAADAPPPVLSPAAASVPATPPPPPGPARTAPFGPRRPPLSEQVTDMLSSAGATFAVRWALGVTDSHRAAVLADRPSIPKEVDSALLRAGVAAVGEVVWEDERARYELRGAFWRGLDTVAARSLR